VKPFSSLILYIDLQTRSCGLSAIIPLAKEGQPALELPTDPTKKVFTSFFKLILPDLVIDAAPIACISPEKVNHDPLLSDIDLISL